jgi:hypothetical protein
MQTTPSFIFPDAKTAFFGSKAEYLAYRAAWKSLTRGKPKLSPAFYAAHALLTGSDLYKAFSPNTRKSQGLEDRPYEALAKSLVFISNGGLRAVISAEGSTLTSPEDSALLREAFEKCCLTLKAQGFRVYDYGVVRLAREGKGSFSSTTQNSQGARHAQ